MDENDIQRVGKSAKSQGIHAWSNLMQEIPILGFTIKLWQDLTRIVRQYSQQLLGTFMVQVLKLGSVNGILFCFGLKTLWNSYFS